MKNSNRTIKEFQKLIYAKMPCDNNLKHVFWKEFQLRLKEFAEETEDLTVETLVEEFGTPEEIARHFFEREDIEACKEKAKRYLRWKIGAIVAGALLVISIIAIITLIDHFGGYHYVSEIL